MKTNTICGSMTFYSSMKNLAEELESHGLEVHVPTKEAIDFASLTTDEKIRAKKQYVREHMNRIKNSDVVIIANYRKNGIGGYVGPNTLIEIAFAEAFVKPLYFVENPEQQPCLDELRGFDFKIFNGFESLQPFRSSVSSLTEPLKHIH